MLEPVKSELVPISQETKRAAAKRSEGNWDVLHYAVIDATRMKEYINYITAEGNSLVCNQTSVDQLEGTLIQYVTYDKWRKSNPRLVQQGYDAGMKYLFLSTVRR